MTDDMAPVLVEIRRGPVVECVHRGTAVVCGPDGTVEAAWGDPDRVILPRSSAKLFQAIPLVESGAARAAGLGTEHLALSTASHLGMAAHSGLVQRWLGGLGLDPEAALRCGPARPEHAGTRQALREAGTAPAQIYHNCSGKHSGFLTLTQHLGAGPDYVDPAHPVQMAVREVLSEMTGAEVGAFATDGCSAPNFALPLRGLATACARVAVAERALSGVRREAAVALRDAMRTHPDLVAGPGNATTRFMQDLPGAAVKSGAEGVYVAYLPGPGLGIALKIDDGSSRGSAGAMAALLARFGGLSRESGSYRAHADAPLLNARGTDCGRIRAVLEHEAG